MIEKALFWGWMATCVHAGYYWWRQYYLGRITRATARCVYLLAELMQNSATIIRLTGELDEYTDVRLARRISAIAQLKEYIPTIPSDKGIFMLRWHALKLEKALRELREYDEESEL